MQKYALTLLFLVVISSLSSCGVLMHRKVECRPLPDEMFGFARHVKVPSVMIYESSEGRSKQFLLARNNAAHTDHYFSDTGCGCLDFTAQMAYSMEGDTIVIYAKNSYIENQESTVYYAAKCTIEGKGNFMGTGDQVARDTLAFGQERITFRARTDDFHVQEMVIEKYRGLIQFTLLSGEVWSLTHSEVEASFKPVFEFENYICPSEGRPNFIRDFAKGAAQHSVRYE